MSRKRRIRPSTSNLYTRADDQLFPPTILLSSFVNIRINLEISPCARFIDDKRSIHIRASAFRGTNEGVKIIDAS